MLVPVLCTDVWNLVLVMLRDVPLVLSYVFLLSMASQWIRYALSPDSRALLCAVRVCVTCSTLWFCSALSSYAWHASMRLYLTRRFAQP